MLRSIVMAIWPVNSLLSEQTTCIIKLTAVRKQGNSLIEFPSVLAS